MTISEFIKKNKLDSQYHELIFFGGSFNPWHSGHTSCLKLMEKDKLIIVMPDHNPFKDVTSQENRFSSLKDLEKVLEIRPENTYLYGGFIKENTHNPTHNWLSQVKSQFPHNKMSLLMGFDSFMSLDKWIEAEIIIQSLDSLYVVSRLDNIEAREAQQKVMKKIAPKLKMIFLGHHDYEHLSSTQIRKKEP